MDILKQRALQLWAQYWLHHMLQKAAEVSLGFVIVGTTVTTAVTVTPIGHKLMPKKPVVKPIIATTAPKPVIHHTTTPASAPPQPQPSTAPPPQTTTSAPAPVVQAPQPVPATQPSPGSGVKQLVPNPGGSSSSSSSSTNTTTSPDTTQNSSSSSTSSTSSPTAPALVTGGYYSTNWSGYAALTGKFTTVSGSWTVPTISGNGTSTTADAAWVGIGGATTSDLIQVGTDDSVTAHGRTSVFAFYEMLPDPALDITSMQISPGDTMTASVAETSIGQWTISITDNTTGQNFTTSVAYTSTYSSAEWIEEDPSYTNGTLVPFDTFDHVIFSAGNTTQNGSQVSIAGSNADPITLVDNSNKPIVTPSVLINSGVGFWAIHN